MGSFGLSGFKKRNAVSDSSSANRKRRYSEIHHEDKEEILKEGRFNWLSQLFDPELCVESGKIRLRQNRHSYSNRQLGTKWIGYFEIFVALALASAVWLAWSDPSALLSTSTKFMRLRFWQYLLPRRYYFEIGFVYTRAIISGICSMLLLYGAIKRSIFACRLYLCLSTFFTSFHFYFLVIGGVLIYDEPYVTLINFPEFLFRPYTVWTVIEFICEMRGLVKEAHQNRKPLKVPV